MLAVPLLSYLAYSLLGPGSPSLPTGTKLLLHTLTDTTQKAETPWWDRPSGIAALLLIWPQTCCIASLYNNQVAPECFTATSDPADLQPRCTFHCWWRSRFTGCAGQYMDTSRTVIIFNRWSLISIAHFPDFTQWTLKQIDKQICVHLTESPKFWRQFQIWWLTLS